MKTGSMFAISLSYVVILSVHQRTLNSIVAHHQQGMGVIHVPLLTSRAMEQAAKDEEDEVEI